VTVRADCRFPTQTVEIENGGGTGITIFEIQTSTREFDRINRRLDPGQVVTFSFGGPDNSRAPNRDRRSLFADGDSGRVEVLTSVGVVAGICSDD